MYFFLRRRCFLRGPAYPIMHQASKSKLPATHGLGSSTDLPVYAQAENDAVRQNKTFAGRAGPCFRKGLSYPQSPSGLPVYLLMGMYRFSCMPSV